MSSVHDAVARVFERLERGELPVADTGPNSGWEVSLAGRTVTRSVLQAQAAEVIALGPAAVPCLLPRAAEEDPALRYVAAHALAQITGETPEFPYFGDDPGGARVRALQTWKRWYEARQ